MSPRLPGGVVPRHYAIKLEPDLGEAAFAGSVAIDIDFSEPSSTITLNAAELDIVNACLVTAGNETVELDAVLDAESERLTLSRRGGNDEFGPGPARLDIAFTGVLNDQLHGFYRSTYTDDSGATHTIATTQFESTDARRAFPCFDEPALKATFATTLVVEEGLLAVSNTAETDRESMPDGRVSVRFATTMPMSTYLVAFVVGPLEVTDPIDCGGVPVRVVHRPGRGDQTGFALDVAAHALKWFSDYYGLPYPSDKLDLVAIPDFAFGAMENLGCVTFREVLLLVDETAASQPELQRVADVINHELAHMWFGDLVTMAWWEGIWLNEAFATFMETACSDAYRPDWRVWSTFCRSRASALSTDALGTTRAVEYPVHSPAEAEDMFDVITYEKGAALVRMLEQYLGAETFRAGVR
ncbi:MAG: M1 family metallopeptidase, partial [Acidimicrobiaceae bacterium]|nr:M1 family metallopeptidase [Acidimicrobiaceae bacterium]